MFLAYVYISELTGQRQCVFLPVKSFPRPAASRCFGGQVNCPRRRRTPPRPNKSPCVAGKVGRRTVCQHPPLQALRVRCFWWTAALSTSAPTRGTQSGHLTSQPLPRVIGQNLTVHSKHALNRAITRQENVPHLIRWGHKYQNRRRAYLPPR